MFGGQDDEQKDELADLVKLLGERPAIRLVICGYASLADRFTLFPDEELETTINNLDFDTENIAIELDNILPPLSKEELVSLDALAKQRQETLKIYLIEKGVNPERLIMCSPKYKENSTEKARVEFSF